MGLGKKGWVSGAPNLLSSQLYVLRQPQFLCFRMNSGAGAGSVSLFEAPVKWNPCKYECRILVRVCMLRILKWLRKQDEPMITVVSGMPDSGKRLLLNVLSVGGLPKYDTSP
ncbi:MAG: hypothetical protein KDE52_14430, partial [Calditrichaeota bacterium]|nr:hypothetical protein [Calditrichota bacterium]